MISRVASAKLDALAGLFQTAEKGLTGSGTIDHYSEVCQEIFEGKKKINNYGTRKNFTSKTVC